MNQTIEWEDKALVLDAFDTLFNKRDYLAAERLWSPNYIQRSANIAPGPVSKLPSSRLVTGYRYE